MKMKFKKFLAVSVAVVIILTAAPMSGFVGVELPNLFSLFASAEEHVSVLDNLIYDVKDEEVAITGCDKSFAGELVLPETIEGYPVTSISDYAFEDCLSLTCITIPEGVTSIGDYAFAYCNRLTDVKLPHSIKSIGNYAFWDGNRDYVTAYYPGTGAQWKTVSVGEENWLTLIFESNSERPYCLGSCGENLLWTLYMDGELVISGAGAMKDYSGADDPVWDERNIPIKKVKILDGVTSIGSYAFYSHENITSITIPDSILSIGDSAFSGCFSLTGMTIPDSVTYIGENAFWGCWNLERVTVHPENSAYFSDEYGVLYNKDKTELLAFPFATSFINYEIPASVNNTEALELLTSSGGIDIQRFTVEEGNELFSTDENGVLYNKDKTAIVCYPLASEMTHYTIPGTVKALQGGIFVNANNLTDVVISEGVEEIYNEFLFCKNLKTITIPSTITILYSTMSGCEKLEKIIVSDEHKYLSSDENGILYDKDKTIIGSVPAKSICDSYVMPDTVVGAAAQAFINCRDFSLTLSDSFELSDSLLQHLTVNEFVVSDNNPNYTVIDGVLYNKDVTTLIKYPIDIDKDLLVIPETVTDVSEYAFISYNFDTEYIPPCKTPDLSDYSGYNKPESLTVHASCPISVNSSKGVSHVYLNVVTSETIDALNKEALSVKSESEKWLSGVKGTNLENFAQYKFMVLECEGYGDVANYVFCNGDHTQLHPEAIERERVDKTCTTDGYVIYYCSYCDKEYRVDFKAEGHKYTMEENPATCTTAGKKVYTCGCGDTYTEKIPALGHNPEYFKVEPTCTQEGYECYKCTLCGTEYARETLPIIPHNYVVTGETPATCTTAGLKIYTCECGDTYTEKIPALGHSPEYFRVEPTCTEEGYECYKCTVCGTEYEKQTISATGHSYDEEIITEPTCTEEGLKRCTCSVCGESYDEEIPVAEHTITVIRKEPTCTKIGTEQYLCEICGNIVGDMVILPKADHTYGEWNASVEPTATKDGYGERSCSVCGASETTTIPKFAQNCIVDGNIIYGITSGLDVETFNNEYFIVSVATAQTTASSENKIGTGSFVAVTATDGTASKYDVVLFGDVNGDGWYDGQDAVLVSCLANGMLTKDDVSEAVYMAADCNHDGVIDQLDVDLLNEAGALLADVDQSKSADVLLETSSEYVEYISLIDQTLGIENEDETEASEVDDETDEAPEADAEDSEPIEENSIFTFIFDLVAILKNFFNFIFSFVNV